MNSLHRPCIFTLRPPVEVIKIHRMLLSPTNYGHIMDGIRDQTTGINFLFSLDPNFWGKLPHNCRKWRYQECPSNATGHRAFSMVMMPFKTR